ncbi:low-affinity phosphate transporter [Friedmanniomyces endolithicus]|nr:low-affinity phosphate transporter [Friedmanniomyces endolithicus]
MSHGLRPSSKGTLGLGGPYFAMPQLSHDAITPEQRADEHYEMEVPQVTRRAAYGYPHPIQCRSGLVVALHLLLQPQEAHHQLEKQLNQANGASAGRKHDDAESSPLLSQSTSWSDNPDQVFAKKLEEELEKVCSFFQLKELEIYGEVDAILKDVEEFEAEHAAGEREGEGHGVRRQSLWARARQQSIFKNFQLPQPRRRRSSTMGTQRTNDSRPRDTEDIQEGDESEEEDAGEGTALTKGHAPDLRTGKWESGKNLGGSTAQHDRRTSVDQNSSAEVRRRPSMAFNDFGDDALQALYDEGITLKKRIVNLYVDVSELRSFVQLNEKGFSKVLKKYDKVLDRNL